MGRDGIRSHLRAVPLQWAPMKRRVTVVAAVLFLAGMIVWEFRRDDPPPGPPAGPSAPSGTPTVPVPPTRMPDPAGPHTTPAAVVPPISDAGGVLTLARSAASGGNPEEIRRAAADLRRAALQDPGLAGELAGLLGDDVRPPALREIAACVLATLPGEVPKQAIARALEASRDPRGQELLLLALGSFVPPADQEDPFTPTGGPRARVTPSGLEMYRPVPMDDGNLRALALRTLRESEDPGVRGAASWALSESLAHDDVRPAFLDAVKLDKSPDVAAAAAERLTQWAAVADPASAERTAAIAAVLERGSLDADASALRFLVEDGLRKTPLAQDEVRRLARQLDADDFDRRRWAFAVLGPKAADPSLPDRDELLATFARAAAGSADPKTREFAAGALASFPDRSSAGTALVNALGDAAWHVRAGAARALGRRGVKDEAAVAALRQAAERDEREEVRRAAQEALEEMNR